MFTKIINGEFVEFELSYGVDSSRIDIPVESFCQKDKILVPQSTNIHAICRDPAFGRFKNLVLNVFKDKKLIHSQKIDEAYGNLKGEISYLFMESFKKTDLSTLDIIPYYDENNKALDSINVERPEQLDAFKYVSGDCKVLELGARYGMVSCVINHRLDQPLYHIAVEPDKTVISALKKNKLSHGADFVIFEGVVSKQDMFIPANFGYSTITEYVKTGIEPLRRKTVEELQFEHGFEFNTLIADCEGALGMFIDENLNLLDQLKLVMYEKDQPHRCDYEKIEKIMIAKKFQCVKDDFHMVWTKQ